MKWFKENPFLAGLAVITVLICGGLTFMAVQAMTQYNDTVAAYNDSVQKLHTLQNRAPFPSKENLDKLQGMEKEYKQELSNLRTKLVKLEPPLRPDVKPQQFQDELRVAVDELSKKASTAGVSIPKDFYLGFNQYVNSPPPDRAAPALARQLAVINLILNHLIDFKVHSIDGLERRQLPEEGPANAQKGGGASVERYPFDISFTTEQSRFRVAFNSLLTGDQFLLVRAVSVQNTVQEGPAIAQPDQNQAGGAAPQPGAEDKAKDLNVIFGREMVKVTMRLEMIHFAETPEAKK